MASAASPTTNTAETEALTGLTLSEHYDMIFSLHQLLETTTESTASDSIQGKIREGILSTQVAIQKINELDLFSDNEAVEEVSTTDLRYMMLSAYLAYLSGLNTHMSRLDAVKKSKMCYQDFLQLCNSYSITNVKLENEDEEESDSGGGQKSVSRSQNLDVMASQRNNKIQRFKDKKTMETKLSELKKLVDREHVDDEIKREFYLTQIKHWANLAVDEIDSCNLELKMLALRDTFNKGNVSQTSSNNSKKPQPFRPFILTKTDVQKKVFGAGYPAIPTMTVDEFYDQKLKEGTLSESVHGGHSLQNWAANPEVDAQTKEEEDAEKERHIEEDDEETIQRMRAVDEWKDEHRRGDGNRHNKG